MYNFVLLLFLISLFLGTIIFLPDYRDSFFPLFEDIKTYLLFIPSYLIFFYGVIFYLINKNLNRLSIFKNSQSKKSIAYILYFSLVSIGLLYVQDFYSLKMRILLLIPSLLCGYLINTILNILACKKE